MFACVSGVSVTFYSTTPVWKGMMSKMGYALLFCVCMRKKTNEGASGSGMRWSQHAALSAGPGIMLTSCSFSKGQVSSVIPCSARAGVGGKCGSLGGQSLATLK